MVDSMVVVEGRQLASRINISSVHVVEVLRLRNLFCHSQTLLAVVLLLEYFLVLHLYNLRIFTGLS